MRSVDKYERVAALAFALKDLDVSAFTVALLACDLNRIAMSMRRWGDEKAGAGDKHPGFAAVKKLLARAEKRVEPYGLTVDESDDGMGYLLVFKAPRPFRKPGGGDAWENMSRAIATFGGT